MQRYTPPMISNQKDHPVFYPATLKKLIGLPAALLLATVCANAQADGLIDLKEGAGKDVAARLGITSHCYMLSTDFSLARPYSSVVLSNGEGMNKDTVVHNALVHSSEDGARILFSRFAACGKPRVVENAVIEVNSQPISALYECRIDEKGNPVSIYLPTSPAAQQFIVKAFMTHKLVPVVLDKYTVAFSTQGFGEVWQQKSKAVL